MCVVMDGCTGIAGTNSTETKIKYKTIQRFLFLFVTSLLANNLNDITVVIHGTRNTETSHYAHTI